MAPPDPIPPRGRSLASICVTAVLCTLTMAVVGTRLWIRSRSRKRSYIWDWDDILALLGLVSPSPPPKKKKVLRGMLLAVI